MNTTQPLVDELKSRGYAGELKSLADIEYPALRERLVKLFVAAHDESFSEILAAAESEFPQSSLLKIDIGNPVALHNAMVNVLWEYVVLVEDEEVVWNLNGRRVTAKCGNGFTKPEAA